MGHKIESFNAAPVVPPTPPACTDSSLHLNSDGLQANITWTDYGVPHVTVIILKACLWVGYAFCAGN